MRYKGRWYQMMFRWIQVKWYIKRKRYIPVEGGVNFYADMKKGGMGVKGYYWKPMYYAVPFNVEDKL